MVYRLTISIVLVITACIQAVPLLEFEREWSQFLTKFNPEYKDLAEFDYRKQIFNAKLQDIKKHNVEYNMGLHTYRKGFNQFSDKTNEEKRQILKGLKITSIQNHIQHTGNTLSLKANNDIPETIDWRTRGAVTSIKSQGYCGSGWAFATIGAIESQYFLAANKSVQLSEQELIDCSTENNGCNGGDPDLAYTDLRKIHGVARADSYPYNGEQHECEYQESMSVAEVIGYQGLLQDEEALKSGVALNGPIAVGIEITEHFCDYKHGIFYDETCSDEHKLNHVVLVVGYGSENGTDYWIVKNSWSEEWGEEGYIRMARNRDNNCQIATHASYPIIKVVS